MKKHILFFTLVSFITLISGCTATNNNNNNNNNNSSEAQGKVQEYFPIKENVKYVYEGKGNEYAAYDVYIDYIDYTSGNKVQQRTNNGGSEIVKVLEIKDGKLTKIFFKGEIYYRENFLDVDEKENEILLMEPLVKGTTWTLKDSSVRTITNTSADITTPSGNYKAIEVTTDSSNGKTVDYYARNIGLVKSVFNSEGGEISSSLSKIEENALFTQNINFYYPDIDESKIVYQNKEVSFRTNETTKQVLEQAYKDLIKDKIGDSVTTNTKVNSLYLKDNIVYLDLDNTFLKEINAGAYYEKLIVQSIVNTLGQYYNTDKVVFTLDNKPYESGHISMEKDGYFKVDFDNTVEATQ
ncbi:GerMN domain-containing protein [Ruminiclostridium herbifermentans]|uniref:GerMN domain-containing protein n=1 Tax=Ruminiclostridium herbifermentans TaxID=2488810 RepID=A0A4U7JJ20_9FIRM|nr:GerMN domain-containing protein [Ruminiclostridium herbifermentans]QNU66003.1 GerMN domain-containing protein [Ruminiclostridium herbifermentans]